MVDWLVWLDCIWRLTACAPSILEAVYGGWYASSAVNETLGGEGVDWHDGGMSEEAAELDCVAYGLADDGDDAHGCCLLVDHADGALVGYDAGDGGGGGVAGYGYHVKAYGADAGHGFEFLYGEGACFDCVYHALVFGHGDEGAGEAADVG